MYQYKYIQNRTITKSRDFSATTSIYVGRNVDTNIGKNINNGDVCFKSGTVINIEAPKVILDAGTTVEKGCILKINK